MDILDYEFTFLRLEHGVVLVPGAPLHELSQIGSTIFDVQILEDKILAVSPGEKISEISQPSFQPIDVSGAFSLSRQRGQV